MVETSGTDDKPVTAPDVDRHRYHEESALARPAVPVHALLVRSDVHTLIIADDFTGACDTGVRFAGPGLPCPVVVAGTPAAAPDRLLTACRALTASTAGGVCGRRALVVDTESRHLVAALAAEAVRLAAVAARDAEVGMLYKKIDSTLRGNVCAELGAVAGVFPYRRLLVAPAFPAAGRTTKRGRCLVNGVPVDRTEFAGDPRSPVRSARIADVLGFAPAVCECAACDLEDALTASAPGTAIVVDAASDHDLHTIALIAMREPRRFVLIGSAGLAGAVARLQHRADAPGEPVPPREGGRSGGAKRQVLGIVGSLNSRSRCQARFLTGSTDVDAVSIDPEDPAHAAAEVVRALRRGRSVLAVTREPAVLREDGPVCSRAAGSVARAIGAIARRAVDEVPGLALVLTGGDTAVAVIDALGCAPVDVVCEIAPGVPALRIRARVGADRVEIPAVTKAGGFGEENVLVTAFEWLQEGRCSR